MFLIKVVVFLLVVSLGSTFAITDIVFAGTATANTKTAESTYSVEARYLHVQKGQTLHNIVKRLYPHRAKEWPKITKEVVRLNPHAFINNDPTRMKAGVRLKLPQRSTAHAVPSTKVKQAKTKKVGVVIESNGSVVAVDKNKVSRKLNIASTIFIGDKVITGEDGFVRLRMVDDAVLELHCYSIMVIEDYAINTANRRSILNLLQGSLRKITGKIGKQSADTYELKTPVASIGVRGTEYALRVFQSKGCGGTVDADDGLYLEVIKGLVDVHNKSGKAVAAKGDTVYVALPESAPKKEKIKPGVLEPVSIEVPESDGESGDNSSLWFWALGIVAVILLL
jgi:hypothetical protein